MHFLGHSHWLKNVLALDEYLINALQQQSLGLWKEEVDARRNQAKIHDGPADVKVVADRTEAGGCDLDSHKVECP